MPCCNALMDKFEFKGQAYVSIPQAVWPSCNSRVRKTGSGRARYYVSIPQAVCTRCNGVQTLQVVTRAKFQYRKRYVRVATLAEVKRQNVIRYKRFNTASGMYALQRGIPLHLLPMPLSFQYRKRYYPVATASLESHSRTGLKWQIGKPPRFFPLLPAVSVNTSSFLRHSYASTPVFMPILVLTKKVENLFSNFPLL